MYHGTIAPSLRGRFPASLSTSNLLNQMQVSVAHCLLGFSYKSHTNVLRCYGHTHYGSGNYALLDAGAYLDSKAAHGRFLGYDVVVRPLEVAWVDGTRVVQSWNIEIDDCHE